MITHDATFIARRERSTYSSLVLHIDSKQTKSCYIIVVIDIAQPDWAQEG